MIALIVLFVGILGAVVAVLYKEMDFQKEDLQRQINNMIRNYSDLNNSRDKKIFDVQAEIVDLKEKVGTMEKTLYSLDDAEKLSKEANEILAKLDEAFPTSTPKEAITSESIEEIAEEELEDWHDAQISAKQEE